MKYADVTISIFILALVLVLVVFMPIIAIKCIQVLFGFTIPLTLKNWAAMFMLLVLVQASGQVKGK